MFVFFYLFKGPPQEIGQDHFRCISQSLSNLTCSWDAPETGVKTKYSLTMLYLNVLDYSTCPTKINSTACLFTLYDAKPYRIGEANLSFKLFASNEFGNLTQSFKINHYQIIKPAEPQNFSVTFHNSTSVMLSWIHPKGLQYERPILSDLRYQLTILRNSNKSKPNITIIDDIYDVDHYHVSNLIPNTQYKIKLRCRMKGSIGDQFWSPFSVIDIKTEPDIPFFSPSIEANSFYNVITDNGSRDVTIFSNPVDVIHHNAHDFKYKILLTKLDDSSVQSLNYDYNTFKYKFSNLLCNTSYKFEIRSQNAKGISQKSDQLLIERCSSLIDKPKYTMAVVNEKSLTLYWSSLPSIKLPNLSFTVHWCKSLRSGPSCIEPLSSLNLNSSSITSVTLNLEPMSDLKVAISVNSQNHSSGLKWFDCIQSNHSLLSSDQFKHFDLKAINSDSIEASWMLQCPSLALFISQFEVLYCKLVKTPICSNITLHSSDSQILIENLDSSTVYAISLKAYTKFGQISSMTKTVKTQISVTAISIIFLLALIFVVFLLIVLYLSIFCLRQRLKHEKEIKEEIKTHWVPKMPAKLRGIDSDLLLNPLCQENHPKLPNQYENRQYMNTNKTDSNSNILTSTSLSSPSSSHSSSSSSSQEVILSSNVQNSESHCKIGKSIKGYVCESEDSGYQTKASTTTESVNESEERNEEEEEVENDDYVIDAVDKQKSTGGYIMTSFNISNDSNSNYNFNIDYQEFVPSCSKPYNDYVLQ